MSKKLHSFEGTDIDVTWDGALCIHVAECGRAKGDLFEAGRKPWCQPDMAESADQVAEVVERCPTGALDYERKDDGPGESAASRNTVTVSNRGPLYVRGDLAIEGTQSDPGGLAFRTALCRCGQSANKPFCDNAHEKAESFTDHGAVGERGGTMDRSKGALKVGKAKDGPLLLDGPFEIIASSGRVAWSGEKAALCRCGFSANKPFCDGAHKKNGFVAD